MHCLYIIMIHFIWFFGRHFVCEVRLWIADWGICYRQIVGGG